MADPVTAENFDAAAYLAANKDVADYIAEKNLDPTATALHHYKMIGATEGRAAPLKNATRVVRPVTQAEINASNANSGIAQGTSVAAPTSQTGIAQSIGAVQQSAAPAVISTSEEQRAQTLRNLTPANFDALAYLQRYPEVAKYIQANLKDFGGDPFRGAAEHYAKFGIAEGRSATAPKAGASGFDFDAAAYLKANPDVAKGVQDNLDQFGGDANAGALAHFLKFGAAEGRQAPTRTTGGTGTTYGDSGGLATGVTEKTPGSIVGPTFSAVQNKLLDILETPYAPYSGQRTAGPSALQTQAFQGLSGLSMPSEIMEAATRSLADTTAAYGRNPYTYEAREITTGLGPVGTLQDYMNPYTQQVVDVQTREAQRQADIQRQNILAQYGGAGGRASAFGGSRQVIAESEAAAALARLQNEITAKGYSTAYDKAQAQRLAEAAKFQEAQTASEAGRRTVAADTARFGLEALSGRGQSALNEITAQGRVQDQELNRLRALSEAGATQRGITQAGLTADYEDFLRQQGYPAQQLKDVMPAANALLGSSSVTNQYGTPSSSLAQILGGITTGIGFGQNLGKQPAATTPPATNTQTSTTRP